MPASAKINNHHYSFELKHNSRMVITITIEVCPDTTYLTRDTLSLCSLVFLEFPFFLQGGANLLILDHQAKQETSVCIVVKYIPPHKVSTPTTLDLKKFVDTLDIMQWQYLFTFMAILW